MTTKSSILSVDQSSLSTNDAKDGAIASDKLFADSQMALADFSFDDRTAAVFDDMVSRSVPLYGEMQKLTAQLTSDFAVPGTQIYDLGCATATTLCHLDKHVPQDVGFVGVDSSSDMLAKAEAKLRATTRNRSYRLLTADLHEQAVVQNASVVIMILTLQFIRPLYRERVMKSIYEGMNDDAALIIFEKVTVRDSLFNRLFIQHYYEMKRVNGYSEVEIANKREALENVLIPYRPEENIELLNRAGFSRCEEFFRWFNFVGLVAVK